MSKQRKPAPVPEEPEQPPELQPPATVQVAFWIWIATAVLSLVYAVLVGDIFRPADSARPAGETQSQYASYLHTVTVELIVELVVLAALYVFFAYKVRAGRNWARMTMTVLVVIAVAYDAYAGTLLTVSGAVLLLSAVAVVLVHFPSASAYIAARRRLG